MWGSLAGRVTQHLPCGELRPCLWICAGEHRARQYPSIHLPLQGLRASISCQAALTITSDPSVIFCIRPLIHPSIHPSICLPVHTSAYGTSLSRTPGPDFPGKTLSPTRMYPPQNHGVQGAQAGAEWVGHTSSLPSQDRWDHEQSHQITAPATVLKLASGTGVGPGHCCYPFIEVFGDHLPLNWIIQ